MVSTSPGVIFTGRFGSGKTEIALNYAVQAANRCDDGRRPILIDLDLVTPYFRSREAVREMDIRGVDVVAPLALSRTIDVPAVVPEILGAIQQVDRAVIIDVGGDEQGARALGQYHAALGRRGYEMYFVVNPYRPQTATPEAVRVSIDEIERSSRMRVSALVSNPNLMDETDPEVFQAGHAIVEDASRLTGRAIAFLAVTEAVAGKLPAGPPGINVLLLRRFFRLPWELEADESGGSTRS
jgi:hypothetical protein